jgi:hypothetical protein
LPEGYREDDRQAYQKCDFEPKREAFEGGHKGFLAVLVLSDGLSEIQTTMRCCPASWRSISSTQKMAARFEVRYAWSLCDRTIRLSMSDASI